MFRTEVVLGVCLPTFCNFSGEPGANGRFGPGLCPESVAATAE